MAALFLALLVAAFVAAAVLAWALPRYADAPVVIDDGPPPIPISDVYDSAERLVFKRVGWERSVEEEPEVFGIAVEYALTRLLEACDVAGVEPIGALDIDEHHGEDLDLAVTKEYVLRLRLAESVAA